MQEVLHILADMKAGFRLSSDVCRSQFSRHRARQLQVLNCYVLVQDLYSGVEGVPRGELTGSLGFMAKNVKASMRMTGSRVMRLSGRLGASPACCWRCWCCWKPRPKLKTLAFLHIEKALREAERC